MVDWVPGIRVMGYYGTKSGWWPDCLLQSATIKLSANMKSGLCNSIRSARCCRVQVQKDKTRRTKVNWGAEEFKKHFFEETLRIHIFGSDIRRKPPRPQLITNPLGLSDISWFVFRNPQIHRPEPLWPVHLWFPRNSRGSVFHLERMSGILKVYGATHGSVIWLVHRY